MLTVSLVLPIIASALRLWLMIRVCLIGRHREYPLFLAFNVLAIIDFVALTVVMRRPVPFFLTYWIAEILLSILALLVMLAVFKPAAETVYIEHSRARFLLPLAIAVIIFVALFEMIYRPLRPTTLGHAASGMYSFVLGVLSLEAIIFLICLALAFSRTIPWGRYDFAILSGFGLSALAKLASYLVWWNVGSRFELAVRYLVPAASVGAALIWALAFSRSEPRMTPREPDPTELQRLIDLLAEHTDYVRQILAHPTLRRGSVGDQPR